MVNPSEEYAGRLKARQEAVRTCRIRSTRLGNLRLLAAMAFFALAWLAWGPGVLSGWWTLVALGAFVALVLYHDYVNRMERRAGRAVAFYENGIARIEDRWPGRGNTRTVLQDESHLYASDLDLFGKGSLFELLSSARTRSGELTLAAWLCAPASREEILKRQQAVDELRNNLDLREDLAVLGEEVEPAIHPDLMKRWGLAPARLESGPARAVAAILGGLGAITLIRYFFFGASGVPAFLAVMAEGAFALYYRKHVREVVAAVDQPAKDLTILFLVLARLERERFQSEKLRELRAILDTAGKPPSTRIRRLARLIELLEARLNMAYALFGPWVLWTTQAAFAIEAWRRRCGPAIGRWLDTVGEIEALCAMAGYAYEHPSDPFPEIAESGTCFEGAELRHPLLPAARSVANSLHLNETLQLLVVSGSNMSGKSTLLRTVGVNAVMALAGAPVRARHLRLSVLQIGSTIRVVDSLQAGTSRFYAEIQRLRDIMNTTRTRGPVLFLLDEILHGTNSHDRAVGAEAVVRGLISRGAVGLVTTHDLALAQVAKSLGHKAANVHFQDHLENGTMVFDYMLRPGVVTKSNALELMRAVGLEV
jgi:hypothetical protein